ncbi:VOC family protein [Actinokineospora enzanensis]|uniref:VOC family protein n=1 Tax=Actinokineospora enzanensis TaxID=155975 RepID=UPI00037DE897|nr:VOC family protein [Actinokineospora enzanensis]
MANPPFAGFGGLSPYLYYADGAAALDWLADKFGFQEKVRFLDAEGVVREAELFAGDTLIMLHGGGPADEPPATPAGGMSIVYVDDVDAHHARAVAAGLDAPAPTDQPYGARIYMADDLGGHTWTFWQKLSDHVDLQPGWQEIRPE